MVTDRSGWRFEDAPENCVCPVHGRMVRAYHEDRLAWIGCRSCYRTPMDSLKTALLATEGIDDGRD